MLALQTEEAPRQQAATLTLMWGKEAGRCDLGDMTQAGISEQRRAALAGLAVLMSVIVLRQKAGRWCMQRRLGSACGLAVAAILYDQQPYLVIAAIIGYLGA